MQRQINLGELMYLLKFCQGDPPVRFDFNNAQPNMKLHGYRGFYQHVALGYIMKHDEFPTLRSFQEMLSKLPGQKMSMIDPEGMRVTKGKSFPVGKASPVWVSNPGDDFNTGVVGVVQDKDIVVIETGYVRWSGPLSDHEGL